MFAPFDVCDSFAFPFTTTLNVSASVFKVLETLVHFGLYIGFIVPLPILVVAFICFMPSTPMVFISFSFVYIPYISLIPSTKIPIIIIMATNIIIIFLTFKLLSFFLSFNMFFLRFLFQKSYLFSLYNLYHNILFFSTFFAIFFQKKCTIFGEKWCAFGTGSFLLFVHLGPVLFLLAGKFFVQFCAFWTGYIFTYICNSFFVSSMSDFFAFVNLIMFFHLD